MSPTKQRQAREARRDAIRAMALGVAEHVAFSHRLGGVRPTEGGGVLFDRPDWDGPRCDCGLSLVPIPGVPDAFGGWAPNWYCGVCGLVELIAACARVAQMAEEQVR